MAIIKLVKPKNDEYYLMNCIWYLLRRDKNSQGLYGGRNLVVTDNPYHISGQFQAVGKLYAKRNPIIQLHFILSFNPYSRGKDLTPYQVDIIARNLCMYLTCLSDYQILYGVHDNTFYPHIHFIVNPVNLRTGSMLNFNYEEQEKLFEDISFVLNLEGFWKGYRPIKLLRPILYEEESVDDT